MRFLLAISLALAAKLPLPVIPADNPMTPAKVELGRHLFYDKRMSENGTQSCASCHRQELAFTDGKALAVGSTGEVHPRSSMSLVNCAYNESLTWADPNMKSLESQALTPMFGQRPVELGMQEHRFLNQVSADATYQRLFAAAFPGVANPYTLWNVTKAIATFERTIVSADSPYDRYRYGHEENAISESAKRGELLFFSSEHAGCFRCHSGWNFSGPVRYEGQQEHGEAPTKDRVPTLRNIAVTAPYGHTGDIRTLEKMIAFYAAGGRDRRGFLITPEETADLVEFLKSLTDEGLLHDPRYSDPWK